MKVMKGGKQTNKYFANDAQCHNSHRRKRFDQGIRHRFGDIDDSLFFLLILKCKTLENDSMLNSLQTSTCLPSCSQ